MKPLKLGSIFLSILLVTAFSGRILHAEYHHVADCAVCHSFQDGTCSECGNIKGVRCSISIPNPPDPGDPERVVAFTSRPEDFVHGDPSYDGVCEVCHTTTTYHRNNASGDHTHYADQDCIPCHTHSPNEFSHGGPAPGGCDPCHGHDPGYGGATGGAGTFASHSTHTEDDTDDRKGPNSACFDCHDTSSYPDFADGATTLAATTVCNNCHSPGGTYDGGAMAKANWGTGVYESDGESLKLSEGNELWCASCHDEDPSHSTSQLYEIVMDNTDATYVGTWTTGSNDDQYGDSVQWHPTGVGDNTAT